jgi:hypothetical protein
MDNVARMDAAERSALMRLTSDRRKSLSPAVVEKDFWVCWVLGRLAAFKDKFYHRGWARYDLAKPGTMKLVPPQHVMKTVAHDYDGMSASRLDRGPMGR